MALQFNPMMMMGGPMMMGGANAMSSMFMMMQMMQMMQLMQMMMGSGMMGGGMPAMDPFGGGCGCGMGMGQNFGLQGYPNMPSMMPMPMPMPGPGQPGWGGQPSWPMSTGPMMDVGSMRGAGPTGQALLNSMRNTPVPPGCCPGYCYRGVKHHLRQVGVNLQGGSAYQAADQLARNPRFREVRVSRDQLRSLPAGAVVVWDRDPSNRGKGGKLHGHISIADGNGREFSDKPRAQMTNYGPRYRVFIPRDTPNAGQQQR